MVNFNESKRTPQPLQRRIDTVELRLYERLGSVLLCPRCDSDAPDEYLHPGMVEHYSRREDDENVRVTRLRGSRFNSEIVPNASSDNPSPRTDGLRLHFECENCGGGLVLNIFHYKGNAVLSWTVYDDPAGQEQG